MSNDYPPKVLENKHYFHKSHKVFLTKVFNWHINIHYLRLCELLLQLILSFLYRKIGNIPSPLLNVILDIVKYIITPNKQRAKSLSIFA
jgi:hypothetical protein